MVIKSNIIGFIIIATLLLVSCKPSAINSPKDYFRFLANPENGLVKEKEIAGIRYKVKYLPTDYLVYNTLKNIEVTQKMRDSIYQSFENSLTFLLNIGPAKNESSDITRIGIKNYEEFSERIEQMSFHASEWISLKSNDKENKPVLTTMENINASETSRNFIVVFDLKKNQGSKENDLCFTYMDEIFNTGTNKFIFKAADMQSLPSFNF